MQKGIASSYFIPLCTIPHCSQKPMRGQAFPIPTWRCGRWTERKRGKRTFGETKNAKRKTFKHSIHTWGKYLSIPFQGKFHPFHSIPPQSMEKPSSRKFSSSSSLRLSLSISITILWLLFPSLFILDYSAHTHTPRHDARTHTFGFHAPAFTLRAHRTRSCSTSRLKRPVVNGGASGGDHCPRPTDFLLPLLLAFRNDKRTKGVKRRRYHYYRRDIQSPFPKV